MAVAASAFLVLSLWLAVVIGPQMRMWPWGPALLALAAALGCAAFAAVRTKRPVAGPGTLVLGLSVTGWFAWRAWGSPVAELAHADLLLLAAAVGCFGVVRAIAHDARAEAVLLWGLAALLSANVVMVAFQINDAELSQFRWRPTSFPSGLYAHYNEGANFLIGASFLIAGSALFGAHRKPVKILWLLVAAAGLAAVWFTRSRGAVFGVVVGSITLAALILVVGSKLKARWFAPAMIAFPVCLLASGFLLYFAWEKTQEFRSGGDRGVMQMMDNPSRLRNYSLAFDATMLNPAFGGGSRSYSWNSLHVWTPGEHGLASHLPEQTHNEILQAATDYGLIGAGGVLGLIGWLSLRGIWRCKFDEEETAEKSVAADALRLGGMAALAGMLVQSSFSFVFHLLPGAMLLGLALGRLAAPSAQPPALARTGRFAMGGIALVVAAAVVWPGVSGTRALASLIPVYYKIQAEPDEDARIARFTRAIEAWPQSDLHLSRAKIHHRHAVDGVEVIDAARLDLALADYLAASRFNPKFPAHFVNAANLLSLSGDADQAEALYAEAIRLQGNMEPAFLAHLYQAEHFRRKGAARYHAGDYQAAVRAMETSLENINQAAEKSSWLTRELREVRNAIFISLARAREAAGDHVGALETYSAAMELRGNHRLRYHAAMVQFRHAMAIWNQRRPEEALPIFLNARRRLVGSRNHLPPGVSDEEVREQIDTIDETVKLLRAAGFGDD